MFTSKDDAFVAIAATRYLHVVIAADHSEHLLRCRRSLLSLYVRIYYVYWFRRTESQIIDRSCANKLCRPVIGVTTKYCASIWTTIAVMQRRNRDSSDHHKIWEKESYIIIYLDSLLRQRITLKMINLIFPTMPPLWDRRIGLNPAQLRCLNNNSSDRYRRVLGHCLYETSASR